MADVEKVEPQDFSKENSRVVEEGAAVSASDGSTCVWNGSTYSEGAEICSNQRIHKCEGGQWVKYHRGC